MIISSLLPSTGGGGGAQDDKKIKEINNFIINKCRDTGAKFVDNEKNSCFAMDLATRQPSSQE